MLAQESATCHPAMTQEDNGTYTERDTKELQMTRTNCFKSFVLLWLIVLCLFVVEMLIERAGRVFFLFIG